MSEEQQEATEEQPLLNPQSQAEAPEAQVEAPIALHEDSEEGQAIPTDTPKEGEPMERPDYIPEKFWGEDGPDLEKLANSYTELEKKFRSGKHKAPEDGYDISQFSEQGLSDDDPMLGMFSDWAKENGVSQAAFEEMVGQYSEISGREFAQFEQDRTAEMSKLGENAQQKIEMAERLLMKAPLNEHEREAIAFGLNSADSINAFLKYHQAITNEGVPIRPTPQQPSMTQADLETAISDPRWLSDPTWRTQIEKKWMDSQQ